jgi:hypothetical protein
MHPRNVFTNTMVIKNKYGALGSLDVKNGFGAIIAAFDHFQEMGFVSLI